jgi:hypothetical protein
VQDDDELVAQLGELQDQIRFIVHGDSRVDRVQRAPDARRVA